MDEKDKSPKDDSDAFSSALNGILSNPDMMSMISSMAEKLKGDSAQALPSQPTEAQPVAASPAAPDLSGAIGALAPLLSGGLSGALGADDDRACLLRALKPYMSRGRCEAIDHIIKISKISSILKKLS